MCRTLIVWCTSFETGSSVPNHTLLFYSYFKWWCFFSSTTFFLRWIANRQWRQQRRHFIAHKPNAHGDGSPWKLPFHTQFLDPSDGVNTTLRFCTLCKHTCLLKRKKSVQKSVIWDSPWDTEIFLYSFQPIRMWPIRHQLAPQVVMS